MSCTNRFPQDWSEAGCLNVYAMKNPPYEGLSHRAGSRDLLGSIGPSPSQKSADGDQRPSELVSKQLSSAVTVMMIVRAPKDFSLAVCS